MYGGVRVKKSGGGILGEYHAAYGIGGMTETAAIQEASDPCEKLPETDRRPQNIHVEQHAQLVLFKVVGGCRGRKDETAVQDETADPDLTVRTDRPEHVFQLQKNPDNDGTRIIDAELAVMRDDIVETGAEQRGDYYPYGEIVDMVGIFTCLPRPPGGKHDPR